MRAGYAVAGAALLCVLSLTRAAADDDWAVERQAELLRDLRAGQLGAEQTHELARLTERLGDLEAALRVWEIIERRYPGQVVPNESSAPDCTYGELAAFWMKRVRHKMSLPEHPMRPDADRLRLMGEEVRASAQSGALNGRDGQVDLCIQTDLDGDAVDEVFMVGKYGPYGQRDEPFMCIARWDGTEYRIAWRANTAGKRMRLFPSMFEIRDLDGDGLKEIQCGFEPNTDNAAMLYFNGETAMFAY